MTNRWRAWSIRGVVALVCAGPAPTLLAHHSTAEYDSTKFVEAQGEITKVLWQNPHVRLEVCHVIDWGVGVVGVIPGGKAGAAGTKATVAGVGAVAKRVLGKADDVVRTAPQHTPDQQALKELVDEATMGGRKPLSVADAETVLDWAEEVRYPGARASPADLATPSNWTANPVPHIHIPGAGRPGGHVPVEPGVRPR
jgi:hypothetical protein